jgi:hypothetical protein
VEGGMVMAFTIHLQANWAPLSCKGRRQRVHGGITQLCKQEGKGATEAAARRGVMGGMGSASGLPPLELPSTDHLAAPSGFCRPPRLPNKSIRSTSN